MRMRVMKFGGTSIGSAERIRNVVEIVRSALPFRPVVIVSALIGVTESLLEMAAKKSRKDRFKEFSSIERKHLKIVKDLELDSSLLKKELQELRTALGNVRMKSHKDADLILSFGERLSAPIVAGALAKSGIPAQAFPAWELGMMTDERFGSAEPLPTAPITLKKKIQAIKVVPVITGYIGKSKKGNVTTLGRGGSDYTAAIIGGAIGAERIQIWKEVDGILTADPRLIPKARIVPELAFEEASELAYFGAKVLHPKTILPAMKKGVPVQVLNTFKPALAGTTIVASFDERKEDRETVEALTFKKGVIAIHIYSPEFFDGSGLMSRIFSAFDIYGTSVDVVTTSVAGVSLTIDSDTHLSQIVKALQETGEVKVERGKAIVCAVGGGVNAAGVAGRMFTALGRAGIMVEMISQAASGVSMTFVVEEKEAEAALRVLHKEYIED